MMSGYETIVWVHMQSHLEYHSTFSDFLGIACGRGRQHATLRNDHFPLTMRPCPTTHAQYQLPY